MLSQNDTNRSLAGHVKNTATTQLFTLTQAIQAHTQVPKVNSTSHSTKTTQLAMVGKGPQMASKACISFGASAPSSSISMSMASVPGTSLSMRKTSGFFGGVAQPPAGRNMASVMPAATARSSNIQMFAGVGSNQGLKTPSFSSSMMGQALGQQISIGKQSSMKAAGAGRGPTVVMNATASDTVADSETKADADYMDRVFLQQKYDNVDHLDPVLHYTGNKYVEELMKNAKLLSAPGKGILASDESNGTCGKRFEAIGVENTEKNRNDYRELLYTTKEIEKYVSGCIMYDETIRQSAKDGRTLVKVLEDKGILTGIKVDTGISIIEGTSDETQTNGLDGLSQRASEYYEMGARFAKWRAVLKITDDGCPSEVAITETAHSLARYAQICQHAGLVPIVEPEILTDGTHDIKTCARISEKVFNAVMNELITQKVLLEGMLLKPNMITSGAQAEVQAAPEEVAFFTVRTLGRTIPPAVPGITFLSGGQSEETACLNLNAINKLAEVQHPWNMTYSFGRALQSSVLTTWAGKEENVEKAQNILLERCGGAS